MNIKPKTYRVGVFDSGMGGLSVAGAIERALSNVEVEFVNDASNVPYGSKSADVLYELVLPILQQLATRTDVIVIACNTVTTTLIGRLRPELPVPLIGVEPMIKPAALQTKTGIVAVCATPTTLASPRYAALKQSYAAGVRVLEPDCSDWAAMIEANDINHAAIERRISAVCQAGADVIVLACTHYHWIEQEIQAIAHRYHTTVLQPEPAVIVQLKRVLDMNSAHYPQDD